METWKEVPGQEKYLVSNLGRVAKISQMKPPTGALPYYVHNIPDGNGGRVNCYRHDWVLAAFVGPKPEGAVVRHLNDVPTDNRLENLAYGTRAENQQDAIKNGRNYWRNQTKCRNGHGYPEDREPGTFARCLECLRERNDKRNAKRRAERAAR